MLNFYLFFTVKDFKFYLFLATRSRKKGIDLWDLSKVNLVQPTYDFVLSRIKLIIQWYKSRDKRNILNYNHVPRFCLKKPGVYNLVPYACHKFDPPTYQFNTAEANQLVLTATQHLVTGLFLPFCSLFRKFILHDENIVSCPNPNCIYSHIAVKLLFTGHRGGKGEGPVNRGTR